MMTLCVQVNGTFPSKKASFSLIKTTYEKAIDLQLVIFSKVLVNVF